MKLRCHAKIWMWTLTLLCPFVGSAGAAVQIDGTVPCGNGNLVSVTGDRYTVAYEIRDTDCWWFRWRFAVKGAENRTLSFRLTSDTHGDGDGAVSERGPAVSHDGGRTWRYEPDIRCDKFGFDYRFGPADKEVHFAQCLQYDPLHWRAFLDSHAKESALFREETLAVTTRKKRPVPLARFGNLHNPKFKFFFTSRHHANEATATYVLEGLAAQVFADDDLGDWLRKNVQLIIVPFVDLDGVIDGDQGKNRKPHDHNRDYHPTRKPIYAEIAGIKRLILNERPCVAMDFHNPAIRSVGRLFQSGLPNPTGAARQRAFAQTLERLQEGPFTYLASDDVPFGVRWNVHANYEKGQPFQHWVDTMLGAEGCFTTIWEVPFSHAHGGRTFSGDDFRTLGRDILLALRYEFTQGTLAPK